MEEMKMNGMVERVAKAIDAAEVAWCAETGKSVADMPVELKATAAIDAMREPTPYMMAATLPIGAIEVDRPTMILCERTLGLLEPDGFPAEAHAGGMDSAQRLVADWRAMVDAALSEPQP